MSNTRTRKIIGMVIIMTAMLIMLISSALADLCVIRGLISYNRGEPIENNTKVEIDYPYYSVTYETTTGTDWPFTNFFMRIFICRQGQDSVELRALGESLDVPLNQGSTEIDWTLNAEKPTEPPVPTPTPTKTPKEPSDSKGGSSSGGPLGFGPPPTVIPGDDAMIEEGAQLIVMYSEWIDVSKYVFTLDKVGDGYIKLSLEPSGQAITLDLGTPKKIDLDLDGRYDISMTLDNISGRYAFVSLDRVQRIPGYDQDVISPTQFNDTRPDRDDNKEDNAFIFKSLRFQDFIARNASLFNFILIVLIIILIILLVHDSKRLKKHPAKKEQQ